MEIIAKAVMPDGTKIQIEDWTKDYSYITTLSIGAYPIAKHPDKYGLIKANETFRLSLDKWEDNYDVFVAFGALRKGKRLEDLSAHFHNGKKDMYYLGMFKEVQERKIYGTNYTEETFI